MHNKIQDCNNAHDQIYCIVCEERQGLPEVARQFWNLQHLYNFFKFYAFRGDKNIEQKLSSVLKNCEYGENFVIENILKDKFHVYLDGSWKENPQRICMACKNDLHIIGEKEKFTTCTNNNCAYFMYPFDVH